MAVNQDRNIDFQDSPDEIDLDIEDLIRADGSIPILDQDFDDSFLSPLKEVARGVLEFTADQSPLTLWD